MADRSDQHIFIPRKRLRGGHAQTLAGNFLPRANALPRGEQRIFKVHDTRLKEEQLERVAVVGYSMGGNLSLKLAGEYGGNPPAQLKAVAAVSPAMDLAASADALHDWRNRLYEIRFLVNLKRRFRRKAELFPGRYDPG